ncbi:GlxA family transcriptional regulator [Vibrio sp. SCSIO 43137]|uniref:GlxA family transcriptional regulator n=1 Tax=Vibrio sp. SCSIO 43137 TaxID=3021011 RepID=UPI002307F47F|nr:helix-turn-helix domain-containing protein [Vibrio sp. SCSIO 43137]WCE31911.1 helix-turn-helix domain-containing protein [Vibrio sp. SCSIO 43137]
MSNTEQNHKLVSPDVRFLLLPLPAFNMLPFGGFLDKLRFSADEEDHSQQHYCSWQVVGLEKSRIVSSSGIPLEIESCVDELDLRQYDYLVVFGSRTALDSQNFCPQYRHILRSAAAAGLTLVSIDNACFLFAEAGLLSHHKVAVHWRHVQEFRAAFPRIDVQTEQLYCIDGKRISCAGGNAAIDLAVELLSRHCGRQRALKGLADMLVDEAREQNHQLKSINANVQAANAVSRHTGRAVNLMRQLMAGNKTVDDLAEMLAISRRQLDRQFKLAFGQTAHEYWAEMRLQHVHWRLINSNHSLQHLTDEVGMQDVSYLCKRFKKRFGVSPGTLRKSKS